MATTATAEAAETAEAGACWTSTSTFTPQVPQTLKSGSHSISANDIDVTLMLL